MVVSTTAAGTISQTARGFSSFFTRSASEEAPTAFSLANSFTACRRPVEDHALMAALEQPPHHVRAHPAKSDHSELHKSLLVLNSVLDSLMDRGLSKPQAIITPASCSDSGGSGYSLNYHG